MDMSRESNIQGSAPAPISGSVFQRVCRFFTEGIWEVDLSSLSTVRRIGINAVRVIHLVFKGFQDNDCPLHAASLTYSTLMSIVPVMALALSVLRGLGAGDWVELRSVELMETLPDQLQAFMMNVMIYVKHTNFTTLGGIGLVLLIWMVVEVLGRVEMSFNKVWGVTESRPILRKFSDYLSILIVVPILVIAATTINATLNSYALVHLFQEYLGSARFVYSKLVKCMPFVATWLAFVFLYKFMPNTKVHTLPAVVSGIIGGSIWIIWQWMYIKFQIGVNQYNAIYATFASVPIFLFWLYISWQVVLLGAEIGFALQNFATYRMEQRAHGASAHSKIMLALSIISHVAQSMMINVPHFEVETYAKTHRVPVRLINEVLDELAKAKLIARVAEADSRYVLLKIPDTIRVKDIIGVVLQSGQSPHALGLDHLNPAIRNVMGKYESGAAEALKEFNINDLLQLHARLAAGTHRFS